MTPIELTPDQKRELVMWAAYLRTCNLQQGYHTLRTNEDEFCCLGAYCNLHDPQRWEFDELDYNDGRSAWYHNGVKGDPSWDLQHRLGITKPRVLNAFITMNDELDYTFAQIADEIIYFANMGTFSMATLRLLATKEDGYTDEENE